MAHGSNNLEHVFMFMLKAKKIITMMMMMSESDNRLKLFADIEDEILFQYCQSDSLSEEGLCEKIELYGLESNNDSQTRNYIFFFAACRNERVTEGIIHVRSYYKSSPEIT